jgi:hypothetical protein
MEITLRNRGIEGKRKRKFEGGGEGERWALHFILYSTIYMIFYLFIKFV